MTDKVRNIQALRGLAVLLVVFFHLVPIERKYGGGATLLPEWLGFGIFGVDLFFAISGFVMVMISRGQFRRPRAAGDFLYRRASRIYPLYWFYTLLVLAVFLVRPGMVNSSQGGEVNILASFLLLPAETLPLVMVGWTLIHEMYFYLVFFVLLLLLRERHLAPALCGWALLVLAVGWLWEPADPYTRLIFHPLTLEFIGGALLGLVWFGGRLRLGRGLALAASLAVVVAALVAYGVYVAQTGELHPRDGWRVALFGVPAMALLYLMVSAEAHGFELPGWLVRVGDASFSIYLSHVLTLSLVGRIWAPFAWESVYDNLVMLPVLLMATLVAGFVSWWLLERPLLRLTRRLKPQVLKR